MNVKPSMLAAILLLAALYPITARPDSVVLPDQWSSLDKEETSGLTTNGLLDLSDQSAKGFTATIRANTLNASIGDYRPRVFQTFEDQPFTNYGSRIVVTFDAVFHDPLIVGDTQFRFGLCDTHLNQAINVYYDIGAPGSTSLRARWDNAITADPNNPDVYEATNWNDFANSSKNLTPTFGDTHGVANGVGLGISSSLATKHSFKYALERTPGGLLQDAIWGNDHGTNLAGYSGFYSEDLGGTPRWDVVNAFGFYFHNDAPFNASGSFTISNFEIHTGFAITSVSRDKTSGDLTLRWESSPADTSQGASYVIQYCTDLLAANWTSISTNMSSTSAPDGYYTSYTDGAPADARRFYRVQKMFAQ